MYGGTNSPMPLLIFSDYSVLITYASYRIKDSIMLILKTSESIDQKIRIFQLKDQKLSNETSIPFRK